MRERRGGRERGGARTGPSHRYVHWGPTTPGRCSLPCQYFPLASLTIQFLGVITMINENCTLK